MLLENKLQIHMYDNEETNYFRLYMINNGAYIWMYIISSLHVWFCRKAEIFPYTRIKLRNRKGTDGGLVALSQTNHRLMSSRKISFQTSGIPRLLSGSVMRRRDCIGQRPSSGLTSITFLLKPDLQCFNSDVQI